MPSVYKHITEGASLYGQTEAVGDIAHVKRTGIMPCGSGDDHVLSRDEMVKVKNHDSADDLTLPEGPLGRKRK